MDALPSDSAPVGCALKSPTLLPQPGDGCTLSGMDLRVRMGMFEEEPTPVVPAIFELTDLQNDVKYPAPLGSLTGFSQLVKRAMWAMEPSDLL